MSSVYNRGSTLWFANDPSAGLMLFYWSYNAEELSSALKKGQWRRRTPNTPQGTFKCGIIPLIRHVMLTSVLESQKAWNGEIEGNLKISKRLRNLKQDVKKCVGWIYSSRGAEGFAAKATWRSETWTDEPTPSTNCVWISIKVHRTDSAHFNMCTDKKINTTE